MTTLYRPVPITSAEQAEALPYGTIARHILNRAAVKGKLDTWHADTEMDPRRPAQMVGWSALVPIEAEEE